MNEFDCSQTHRALTLSTEGNKAGVWNHDKTALHSPTMTVVKLCNGSKEHLALPSCGSPVREKSARCCRRSGTV